MKKKILIITAIALAILGSLCAIFFQNDDVNNAISTIQNVVMNEIENIETYEMTDEDISPTN